MAENKEKQTGEAKNAELRDLSQELSAEELKDVQGGDLHIGTKPIVKKVQIRP
jgi:hypothetical protein